MADLSIVMLVYRRVSWKSNIVSLSFEGQPSMSGQWKHLSDNSSENYAFSVRFDVAINFADRFSQVYQNCHILSTVGWPSLSDRHVVSIVGTNSCWTKTSQSLWHGLHRKLPRKGEPPSISAGNGHICDFTAMWQIHTNDYWQTTSGASPLTGGFTLTQQVA